MFYCGFYYLPNFLPRINKGAIIIYRYYKFSVDEWNYWNLSGRIEIKIFGVSDSAVGLK